MGVREREARKRRGEGVGVPTEPLRIVLSNIAVSNRGALTDNRKRTTAQNGIGFHNKIADDDVLCRVRRGAERGAP